MQRFKQLTEQELVHAFCAGTEHAIDELVNRTKAKVYTAIYFLIKDKYLAEDILQETYIKAIQKMRQGAYNEDGKFTAWLTRIGRNLCMDYFRSNSKHVKVTLPNGRDIFDYLDLDEAPIQEKVITEQSGNRLRLLLNLIPQDQRDVIIMRLYADMSFKEIADETSTTINTCLGRMRYGLLNLRRIIKERELVL